MARRRTQAPAELNLVPVMNLMALLVPFLLMSAQFVSYAVIDTALPTIAPELAPEDAIAGGRPAPLVITIGGEGFLILGVPDVLADEPNGGLVPCRRDCDSVDAFDVDMLSAKLWKIKRDNPAREDVVLSPESWVPYELVVATMDAVRLGPAGPDGDPVSLFPRVVIAARGQ